jgi:hypothetical protein
MQTYIRNRVAGGYDLSFIAVVGISTLVLVLHQYYPLQIDFPQANELIYYLLIPLAAGGLLFRDRPPDYGIRIGRWKLGILATVVGLAIMALVSLVLPPVHYILAPTNTAQRAIHVCLGIHVPRVHALRP